MPPVRLFVSVQVSDPDVRYIPYPPQETTLSDEMVDRSTLSNRIP